jgi:hypothetical protein
MASEYWIFKIHGRLVRAGAVRDHDELAALGHVSRARITQIMKLRDVRPQGLPPPGGRWVPPSYGPVQEGGSS